MNSTQIQRLWWRSGFFVLFVLAPPLNIFRLDLELGHFIILGQNWTLGIDPENNLRTITNIIVRVFFPIASIVVFGIWLSWRYGRLYCGWLCPHFSVVEIVNGLMRRASGKLSVWDKETLPENQKDGVTVKPGRAMWWAVALAVLFFAFLWSVTFLTYLLPPDTIWGNLVAGELTRNQTIFLVTATILLMIEFTLARHLFCRFGCAVGLFQSLVWMGNDKALVVGFDRSRASLCVDCDKSCEHACPMRLKPRQIKRKMFTCTQCQQCVQACDKVNRPREQTGLLQMLQNECALDASRRDFGHKPQIPKNCFCRDFSKEQESRAYELKDCRSRKAV